MRKFLLGIYLWLMGVVICEHEYTGLRYCHRCEIEQRDARWEKHRARIARLEALQTKWRNL
jgi:hypothetical protein